MGQPGDLAWLGAAINFGEGARTRGAPATLHDGGFTSNQALPPFPASQTTNPGQTLVQLPGVVVFGVDQDGDGVGDGGGTPALVPALP